MSGGERRPEGARTISTRRVYEGRVLSLDVDEVEEPGDVRARREVIRQGPSVAILVVEDDGRLVLVRQWRHAVQEMMLEIPAGRLEKGEEPAAGAQREMGEEIALRAAQLEPIGSFYPTPGVCDERMNLFRATGLRPCESHPDEDERIEVRRVTLDEARALIREGAIHEAKSVIAILLECERRAAGRA